MMNWCGLSSRILASMTAPRASTATPVASRSPSPHSRPILRWVWTGPRSSKQKRWTAEEDEIESIGAGDQGMMFGFACNETKTLMPLPIDLAHRLTRRLAELRKNCELPWLGPDGKSQVTVEYSYGKPKRIHTVLISTQHLAEISPQEIRDAVIEKCIMPTLPAQMVDDDLRIFVNPTGRFVVGGPMGDAGLTGRKIIVDTYGGMGRHGGGAFSGKDCTKVDRSGAYAARWVAKNIVAPGWPTVARSNSPMPSELRSR